MNKNCCQNKPKPSKIVDILINNRYVVNLIYDQYIAKGSYKTVCEYLQSDERCTSIVRRDIWKKKSSNNNDDDNLIEQLIDDDNDHLDQSNGIITTNIIQKILTMDQDLIINDRNKLSSNKWLIVQRLISNGYNKKLLYTTISSNNNNNNNNNNNHHQTRTENYLSSVLVCGKCDQSMVCDSNRFYKDIRLRYYRCKNRITSYKNHKRYFFDKNNDDNNDNKVDNDNNHHKHHFDDDNNVDNGSDNVEQKSQKIVEQKSHKIVEQKSHKIVEQKSPNVDNVFDQRNVVGNDFDNNVDDNDDFEQRNDDDNDQKGNDDDNNDDQKSNDNDNNDDDD